MRRSRSLIVSWLVGLALGCGAPPPAPRELVAVASSAADHQDFALYLDGSALRFCDAGGACVDAAEDPDAFAVFSDPARAIDAAISLAARDARFDGCDLEVLALAGATLAVSGAVFFARRAVTTRLLRPLTAWVDLRPDATDAAAPSIRAMFEIIHRRATEEAIPMIARESAGRVSRELAGAALVRASAMIDELAATEIVRYVARPLRVEVRFDGVDHLVGVPETFVRVVWIEATLRRVLGAARDAVLSRSISSRATLESRVVDARTALAGLVGAAAASRLGGCF